LSLFLSFDLRFLDRAISQGAADAALDPIERVRPDSYLAGLNLRDRPRMQSASLRQFVLADPACGPLAPESGPERLAQRLFREVV
jgi:hypothetical protein